MLHLRFSHRYDQFHPADEVVVDPADPGCFLLLRRVPVRYAKVLAAMNAGAVELLGPSVSTAAIRTLLNLPRSPSHPGLHLVR